MSLPTLANSELAIMNLLWEQDQMTARQVREELYPDASKDQHGTVQKLLQRLEQKEFIERDRSLAVHLFSAKISREEYTGSQIEFLADKLTGGSLAPVITQLVEKSKISQNDIDQIREILKGYPKSGGDN